MTQNEKLKPENKDEDNSFIENKGSESSKKNNVGQKKATNRSPYKRGGRRGNTTHKKNEYTRSS